MTLSTAASQRILRYRDAARSSSTVRTYHSQFETFTAWCHSENVSPGLPVAPMIVAAWISARADDGLAQSSIHVGLAAIVAAHRKSGLVFDAHDPAFRETLAGLRRLVPIIRDRQAAPLRRQVLAEVLQAADTDRQSIRDAALFATLYIFGLRRSELVALDYAQRGDGQGVITFTADNIEVSLFTSKADPTQAVRVVVPKSGNPVASAAIESWIASAGLVPGAPYMRRFLGHGALGDRISSDGVGRVVKRAMLAHFLRQGLSPHDAAVEAARFTGHSGRVGLIVSAAEAGVSDTAIAKSTRHKTTALIARYAQQADQTVTAKRVFAEIGV